MNTLINTIYGFYITVFIIAFVLLVITIYHDIKNKTMGYRRNATDANQQEIVDALRKAGCSVSPTSQAGEGFPDLVVGIAGTNYLLEVKDGNKPPSKQKLTVKQVKWHKGWKGSATVVNSVEQAFKAVGL